MFFCTLRARRKSAASIADGHSEEEAEEQVDSVDRERSRLCEALFQRRLADALALPLMLNTAVGNEPVVQTILGHDADLSKAVPKPRTTNVRRALNSAVIRERLLSPQAMYARPRLGG